MVWNSNDYLSSARLCSKAFQKPLLCLVEVSVQFYFLAQKWFWFLITWTICSSTFLQKREMLIIIKCICKKVVLGLFDHLISCWLNFVFGNQRGQAGTGGKSRSQIKFWKGGEIYFSSRSNFFVKWEFFSHLIFVADWRLMISFGLSCFLE